MKEKLQQIESGFDCPDMTGLYTKSKEPQSAIDWVIERQVRAGFAKPNQYVMPVEDSIELAYRYDELVAWKESALEVEKEWDAQTIAAMLGGKIGESCQAVVAREVPLLIEKLAAAQAEAREYRETLSEIQSWCSNFEACPIGPDKIADIARAALAKYKSNKTDE